MIDNKDLDLIMEKEYKKKAFTFMRQSFSLANIRGNFVERNKQELNDILMYIFFLLKRKSNGKKIIKTHRDSTELFKAYVDIQPESCGGYVYNKVQDRIFFQTEPLITDPFSSFFQIIFCFDIGYENSDELDSMPFGKSWDKDFTEFFKLKISTYGVFKQPIINLFNEKEISTHGALRFDT